jgi:hypothetical protein
MQKKFLIRIALVIAAIIVLATLGGIALTKSRDGRDGTFTMDEVRAADTATDCLVAIDGNVYELTEYATENTSIRPLCGTDASEAVRRITTSTLTIFEPLKVGVIEEAE